MKKWMVFLLLILLLCGCAAGEPLDEGFDEAQLEARAAELISLANAGDYAGVCALLRPDLNDVISAEALEEGWAAMLEQSGEFVDIERVRFSGAADPSTGEPYATVVASCRYAHGRRIYTLSFDRGLALVGLYLK